MKALTQPLLFPALVDLTPHICFDCMVNGHELTATVTHKEYRGSQTLYLVSFSDGHQDVYSPGDELVREGFGRTRQLDGYEEAIYDDLCVVPLLHKGDGFTCIAVEERDGERFNVWMRKRKEFYSAFYNGAYQFTLCRLSGEWIVSSARDRSYAINLPLARFVSEYLGVHPF